jgi:DNA-binding IclR family transcriptional regulator
VKRRKLLLIIALSVRDHGESPPWTILRRAVGVDRISLLRLMQSLQREGLLTYSATPGSARVTPQGMRQAVGR